MSFEKIIADVNGKRLAGIRFQKEGHGKYRDRITVYYDGGVLFERFCYGEAAGLVFTMKGNVSNGLCWNYDACAHSQKEEAPRELTAYDGESLFFDGKASAWEPKELLKTDRANGYSLIKMLLAKRP